MNAYLLHAKPRHCGVGKSRLAQHPALDVKRLQRELAADRRATNCGN